MQQDYNHTVAQLRQYLENQNSQEKCYIQNSLFQVVLQHLVAQENKNTSSDLRIVKYTPYLMHMFTHVRRQRDRDRYIEHAGHLKYHCYRFGGSVIMY